MTEAHKNGIQILIDIIKEFSPDKPVPEIINRGFTRFFREKNRAFAPKTEDLSHYNDDNFTNGIKLGEIQFAQDEKLLICSFESSQPLTERSGKKAQYEKGKSILKEANADAGIFIFYSDSPLKRVAGGAPSFRFSLIYPEYTGTKRQWSYFKRFTYYVSPELTNKTFLQQIGDGDFSSLKKIKEAFSVDPVTKQFYNELQSWYFWAMDKIKFPDDYKYSNDPAKDKEIRNAANLIRLITRIIFIWFLMEKRLIPQELFSGKKLSSTVNDFMNGKKASNFYNAVLQNLFFGTLNQKMNERKFAEDRGYPANKKEYGVKNLFRYADKFLLSKNEVLELFKDIPFLNGGLFDCLDKEDESGKVINIDGFSRNLSKQTIIPDYLFFQQAEERVDLSSYGLGSNRTVRGLIEILNSYNFTIDENTPVDQEIALDPELLGKVFENLLASYNPETATTARKATGSYYTPREIVDYMVGESLVAYLANAINNAPQPPLKLRGGEGGVMPPSPLAGEGRGEGNNDSRLRHLLSYTDDPHQFSPSEVETIITAIDNIKILDPACGSGAFPMGILHKLVYALQKLDPENKYWHELQYKKALKESEEVFKQGDKNQRQERLNEINEAFDDSINYPDYARKLYLIENCIYGVDIQPIAIQISKLRFFISLVLDQKVDKSKENLGIRALPNLETKFVAANTLIGLDRPQQSAFRNPEIEKKEQELKELRHRYFTVSTRTQKRRYQEKDKKIREQIANLLINDGWGDATAKKIANFDLYDQNASADFFDPEWMFGIQNPSPLAGVPSSNISSSLAGEGNPKTPSPFMGEGGFDVVIGNPPYGCSYSAAEKNYFKKHYKSAKTIPNKQKGSLDTFTLFIEQGFNALHKRGCLCYIVPIAITSSDSMAGIHNLLESHCEEIRISSYAVRPQPVFQNAVVNTSILFFLKTETSCKRVLATKMYRKNKDFDLQHLVSNLQFIDIFNHRLIGRYPKISLEIEKSILDKIYSQKNSLGELMKSNGKAIYYRTTGGRYFKVITNYSTGSTKEKPIFFDKKIANSIGAILSSNLYFWFYQIYSNNLDLKSYEIESFKIPIEKLTDNRIEKLEGIYSEYLKDIEKNVNIRQTTRYSNIDSFKEYKIGKSKHIIDQIDDFICPLYGMTQEEIDFIKNYEIEFRLNDDND